MIRQLGKPAIFFTFSASEYRWPRLLRILYRLRNRKEWPGTDENLLTEMSPTERTNLVNDDPVTCCLFFNKLIDTIINLLKSRSNSPFQEYYISKIHSEEMNFSKEAVRIVMGKAGLKMIQKNQLVKTCQKQLF